jgi:endogenous inhibitor of DNA gyrase (YacG/DUF329 family)
MQSLLCSTCQKKANTIDKNLEKPFCNKKCQNEYYNQKFKFGGFFSPNKEKFYCKKNSETPVQQYRTPLTRPSEPPPPVPSPPPPLQQPTATTEVSLGNENNRYQFLELSTAGNEDLFKEFIQQEEKQDFPLCRDLVNSNHIHGALKKGGSLYVVYDNTEGGFLGFSIVFERPSHIYIDVICTKKGVGAILLNHIKNIAIKKGKKFLELTSTSNEETFNFYIKNGFFINTRVYAREQDYYKNPDYYKYLRDFALYIIADYEKPLYMDLITNYNDMRYNNENGLEVIRSKIIALNKVANMKFELKNNYTDKEKEEINNTYKQLTDESSSMYDKNKSREVNEIINDYGRNHFIQFGIEMVKPLKIVNSDIVDRKGQNIVKETKYDKMTDKELLNELNESMKQRLVTCKICQSFTGVMDKKSFIPFCDYECQKAFYNK